MASFRKTPSGKWEARITRRGMPSLSKSFKLKSDAELWAKEHEKKLDSAFSPKRNLAKAKTKLSEAITEFKELNDAKNYKNMPLRTLEHDLGEYSIEKITSSAIIRYLAMLAKTPVRPPPNKKPETPSAGQIKFYSSSSIRQIYFALKKVITWHSTANDYPLPEALSKEYKLPSPWENPRERILVGNEEERLLDAARNVSTRSFSWPLLIRFAILTGMRNQEMILARWTDFRIGGKSLIVPDKHSKTGKGRVVALSKEAREILEILRKANKESSKFVFFEFLGNPRLATDYFPYITKKAGLEDFHFHDLRHHALTMLASSGRLTVEELMAMSGHRNLITWTRYLRLFPDYVADKLDGAKLVFENEGANVAASHGEKSNVR